MKRIKFFIAAIGTIIAAESATAQTLNDVNAKFNEAATMIQAKDYVGAIPALEATIELGFTVGDDALNTVQKAQNYLPVCYFQVGLGFCQENKFDEAIPYLNTAAQLSELYGDAKTARNTASLLSKVYYAMGVEAFNTENYPKAIEVFAKGYTANPTDTQLGMALAESYSKSGDLENGMKIYGEIAALGERHSRYVDVATEAKAKVAEYLSEAASKLAKANLMDEAYAVIDAILEVDPANTTVLLMRLQFANNAKQYAKVIEWGEEAAEAQSDETLKSTAYFLLGAAYQNTERMDEAIAQYSKVTAGQFVTIAKTQIAEIRKAQTAK